MLDWKRLKLEKVILSANTGLDAIKRAPIVDEDTGIKCLRIQDVSQSKEYQNWGNTKVTLNNYEKFALKKGEIIIARTGNTIGVNMFINKDVEAVFNNGLIRIRVDKKICEPKYVYYNFRSNIFKAYIQAIAFGTSTQPNMQINSLLSFEFNIPTLQEQKAIASILSALDDKIELNLQMNKTLEEMATALYKNWFVDFGPFQDGEFVDSELGEIPKGWKLETLKDVTTELRRGISPKYTEENGVLVLNQRCIRNHIIDFSIGRRNDSTKKKVDGRLLELGDVLINSTGVGTLGRMAPVLELKEKTIVDSHVSVVRPNNEYFKKNTFSRLMLHLEPMVTAMGEGSTGQTELSRVALGEIKVMVPPLEKQEAIELLLNGYSSQTINNLSENQILRDMRDTLLPKLISGEVRIKDAEKTLSEVL